MYFMDLPKNFQSYRKVSLAFHTLPAHASGTHFAST